MPDLLTLELSDEQKMLVDAAAKLFRADVTPTRLKDAGALGYDAELWRDVHALGLPQMRLPEAVGGMDASLLDVVLVADQAGRHLAPVPLVEAIVAGRLLGTLDAKDELEAFAAGKIVTLALKPIAPGRPQIVPGAAVADLIVALDGDQVIAIRGAEVIARPGETGATPLGAVRLDSGDRRVIAAGANAVSAYLAAVEEWKLGTAAALAGLSAAALEKAAEYSRDRVVFGKKIGSFQGLAHPLANSATDVEGARLLVWQAVSTIAAGKPDAGAYISMALFWASEAAGRATECALRTFGGYGVSLENDIQLYYRRAKALALVAGDPEDELQRAGDRLWADASATLPTTGPIGITFEWGATADAYAADLRRFIDENADEALRKRFHHSSKGFDRDFHRKLAQAGLLFPDLPVEQGGQDRSPIEVAAANAVWEELDWTSVPASVTDFVLLLARSWGTPEAKAEIIPRIMAGDALGCLGFSEPQGGSDIFGTRFSAVRDGDEWVLNGQKMFTTSGHLADYILLLTRTSSDGAKHEGLSVFIVPMSLPGIEIHPVYTLQDERTNITYFGDVRVPGHYLLGEAGNGLQVMHTALEREHGGITYHYAQLSMLRHAVAWAQSDRGDGRPIDNPKVRRRLARAAVLSAVSDGLCRADVWKATAGCGQIADGPMAKLFSTESLRASAADLTALAAPDSLVAGRSDIGIVELMMRRAMGMTIYGGTSEIHRSLVAEHLLGMPKSRS